MMKIASSCPLVVNSPTFEPVRVIMALVATVVPCLKTLDRRSKVARSMPINSAVTCSAFITPDEKSPGVVAALLMMVSPSGKSTVTSVKVPPVSMPMM